MKVIAVFTVMLLLVPLMAWTMTSTGLSNISQTKEIYREYSETPIFKDVFEQAKNDVANAITQGPVVEVPRDGGGGVVHEQHKKNGYLIRKSAQIYAISGEKKYLEFSEKLLLAYARLYPNLGKHPLGKKVGGGRLFWQNLNESVWLLNVAMGWDLIRDDVSEKSRNRIENNVLIPMADFLSKGSPETFDKIHNHGTWATAAVGTLGYVIENKAYIEKALYGLNQDGKTGFLKQLDMLFSPDGYYAEGPYYQRYALSPFMLFAQTIHLNDPDRKIFEHRDGVLFKAVYACVDMSYQGKLFPINDAIKEKGLDTNELVDAVAIAYTHTKDSALLDIAQLQKKVSFSSYGFEVAKALLLGKATPFEFETKLILDGIEGESGGLAVMRKGNAQDGFAFVLKNTSQGMGHGHFDRLSWFMYDNGNPIFTDYGASRFLNIEAKNDGRYLPENQSWAKQTVAHNTLVVDGKSQFDGNWVTAQKIDSTIDFFESTSHVSAVSAIERDAYPGVVARRTVFVIKNDEHPLTVDIVDASSAAKHQYDLPFFYEGTMINYKGKLAVEKSLKPFGKKNGYQHLWHKGVYTPVNGLSQITLLNENRFYSLTSPLTDDMDVNFLSLGANDPMFNLLHQNGILYRKTKSRDALFTSAIEIHGDYNASQEYTLGSTSSIKEMVAQKEGDYVFVKLRFINDKSVIVLLSYDLNNQKTHRLSVDGQEYAWKGFYDILEK